MYVPGMYYERVRVSNFDLAEKIGTPLPDRPRLTKGNRNTIHNHKAER